jgi:hypothetical protein
MTPFEGAGYYTEAGEADRQAVNEWIRTSVKSTTSSTSIRQHPNGTGFTAMAAAIDLKAIC